MTVFVDVWVWCYGLIVVATTTVSYLRNPCQIGVLARATNHLMGSTGIEAVVSDFYRLHSVSDPGSRMVVPRMFVVVVFLLFLNGRCD